MLTRIGPFPVEWVRPLFYWLAILVFLAGDANRRSKAGTLSILHLGPHGIALVAVTYVCWDDWRIGQIIANSVMFFGPRKMYVSLLSAAVSLWAFGVLWGGRLDDPDLVPPDETLQGRADICG